MKGKNTIMMKIMMAMVLSGFLIVLVLGLYNINIIKTMSGKQINNMKVTYMEDYDRMIRNEVQTAVTIIQHYYDSFNNGEITEEQAKELSKAAVKALRYGDDESGYFWIDETTGILIAHAMLPEQEGTNRINTKDPNGVELIKEIIEAATKGKNNGYTDYQWEKPKDVNTGKLSPKRAYSKYFKEWNWVLSTGNYIDDIDKQVLTHINEFKRQLRNTILGTLGILIGFLFILFIVSVLVSRRISRPIMKMTKYIGIDEKGNVNIKHIDVNSNDEIGYLAGSINSMSEQVKGFIKNVQQSTINLGDSVGILDSLLLEVEKNTQKTASQSEKSTEDIHIVSNELESIKNNLKEIEAAISEIAYRTEETTTVTSEVSNKAEKMKDYTGQSRKNTENLYNEVKANVEMSIDEVKKVRRIEELSNQINQISSQTNLLALNAAIEAARAGEAGRGFSVVADEIRKLAEQSNDTVDNIQSIVNQVISSVDNLSLNTEKVMTFIEQSILPQYDDIVKLGDSYSGDAIHINKTIMELSATIEEVTASTESINSQIDEVFEKLNGSVSSIEDITSKSAQTVENIKKIKSNSENTLSDTGNLSSYIEKFKI